MSSTTQVLLSTTDNPIVRVTGTDAASRRVRGEKGGEWISYAEFRKRLHQDRLVIRQVHAIMTDNGVRINGRVQSLQFILVCPRCGRLLGFCKTCGNYHKCDKIMNLKAETEGGPYPGPSPDEEYVPFPPQPEQQ